MWNEKRKSHGTKQRKHEAHKQGLLDFHLETNKKNKNFVGAGGVAAVSQWAHSAEHKKWKPKVPQ